MYSKHQVNILLSFIIAALKVCMALYYWMALPVHIELLREDLLNIAIVISFP